MSFSCSPYQVATLIWPFQSFPRNLFPRWSGQRLLAAQAAWNYYELVESKDAALRVTASQTGNENIVWTPFDLQSNRMKYNYGKWLHQQACCKSAACQINWASQRDLGYTAAPMTTIWSPIMCPPPNTVLGPVCPSSSF